MDISSILLTSGRGRKADWSTPFLRVAKGIGAIHSQALICGALCAGLMDFAWWVGYTLRTIDHDEYPLAISLEVSL
jgi:hypothetical protein